MMRMRRRSRLEVSTPPGGEQGSYRVGGWVGGWVGEWVGGRTRTIMMRMRRRSRLEVSSPPCRRAAVRPKKVLAPVHSTVPSTSPRTTCMECRCR